MLALYLSALETETDKETFSSFYQEHYAAAMRAALRRCGGSTELAEDAVHNAFLQIIRNWKKFLAIPCNERAFFLVSIVKYRTLDIIKEESAQQSMPVQEPTISEDEVYGFLLEQQNNAELIAACVEELPEMYKTVLELRYRHDFNNREIAKLLGISESNVGVRIFRALQKLRTIAEKKGITNHE